MVTAVSFQYNFIIIKRFDVIGALPLLQKKIGNRLVCLFIIVGEIRISDLYEIVSMFICFVFENVFPDNELTHLIPSLIFCDE